MKKLSVMLICLSLCACGGRAPQPVMAVQYGDQNKSCRAIEMEMSMVEGEMRRILPKADKTGQNVALGVAGAFLLVPWFFMDFKNGEAQEYEAYRQRYNNLAVLAADKNCGVKPKAYPSADEMREAYEAQQRQKTDKSKK